MLAVDVPASRGDHLPLAHFECRSPGRCIPGLPARAVAAQGLLGKSHSVVFGEKLAQTADQAARHHCTPTLPGPAPSCSVALWGVIATYHYWNPHIPSSQRHEVYLLGLLDVWKLWYSACRDGRDTFSLITWFPEIPHGPIYRRLITACCQDGFAMLADVSQQPDWGQTPVNCWHQLILVRMAWMISSSHKLRWPITTTKQAKTNKQTNKPHSLLKYVNFSYYLCTTVRLNTPSTLIVSGILLYYHKTDNLQCFSHMSLSEVKGNSAPVYYTSSPIILFTFPILSLTL